MTRPPDPPCPLCGAPCPTKDLFCWMCQGRVREKPEAAAPPPRGGKDHPLAHAPKASQRSAETDLSYLRKILPPLLIVMAVASAALRQAQGFMIMVVMLGFYLATVAKGREHPGPAAARVEAVASVLALVVIMGIGLGLAVMITCSSMIAGLGGK